MEVSIIYAFLSFIAGSVLLGIAFWGWKQRDTPAAKAFIALSIAMAAWSILYGFQTLASDLPTIVTFAKLKYLGIAPIATFWLIFTLFFAGYAPILSRRNLALLAIVPVVTVLLVWTNEWHQLIWTEYAIASDIATHVAFMPEYGIGYLLFVSYGYLLMIASIFVLLRLRGQIWHNYRLQPLALLVSVLIPLIVNILDLFGVNPLPGFDLTPVSFAFSGVIGIWVITHFEGIGSIPFALNAVVTNLPDGVLVTDTEHRVLSLNQAMKQLLGVTARSAVGLSVNEVLPNPTQIINIVENQVETSAEITFGQVHTELRISPLLDQMQTLRGGILVFRDVTDQKKAQKELKKRLRQLAALHEISQQISSVDMEKLIRTALDICVKHSRAKAGFIALYEDEQLKIVERHGNYGEELKLHILDKGHGIVGRVISTHQPELVLDVQKDDGYTPDIEATKAQMVLPLVSQNQLLGIVNLETPQPRYFSGDTFRFLQLLVNQLATALDNARLYQDTRDQLTELQDLYAEVSQLEETKTDMIRLASHDLINPLGVVQGLTEILLQDKDQFPAEFEEYFEDILRASDRMGNIIKHILSVERIEEIATSEDLGTFDLTAEVDHIVHDFRSVANEKGIRYKCDMNEDDEIVIQGDQVQIGQAINNLIGNAIKYTPNGGSVMVRLRMNDQHAIFEVKDTGFGIPKQQQARIFEPFFRADMTETQEIDGTGLGLHIVKRIIERHYGKMIFNSEYRKGSIFGFIIPAVAKEPQPQPEPAYE